MKNYPYKVKGIYVLNKISIVFPLVVLIFLWVSAIYYFLGIITIILMAFAYFIPSLVHQLIKKSSNTQNQKYDIEFHRDGLKCGIDCFKYSEVKVSFFYSKIWFSHNQKYIREYKSGINLRGYVPNLNKKEIIKFISEMSRHKESYITPCFDEEETINTLMIRLYIQIFLVWPCFPLLMIFIANN